MMSQAENYAGGVSVLIPTFRKSGFAVSCLESVCVSVERYRGQSKEIVLCVDRELVPQDPLLALKQRFPFVRIVRNEGFSGAPRARSFALACARYDLLLFTDDDCHVPEEWVDQMVEGALRHGVVTGGVAAIPSSAASELLEGEARSSFWESLWKMEELIDLYRLRASDSRGSRKYASFPNLAIRRELLPPVPFDCLFAQSADDMDLSYRLRLNGRRIVADEGLFVRTAYPSTLKEAVARKFRHARGIAYVHRRMGRPALRALETGCPLRILLRWIRISLKSPFSIPMRLVFLLLNLSYCFALFHSLLRLKGIREFPREEILGASALGNSPVPLPIGRLSAQKEIGERIEAENN